MLEALPWNGTHVRLTILMPFYRKRGDGKSSENGEARGGKKPTLRPGRIVAFIQGIHYLTAHERREVKISK